MTAPQSAVLICLLAFAPPSFVGPEESPANEEVPLERCDRLPVVGIRVGKADMRFLVDTGATSLLNLKSFPEGEMREISVTSYSGTESTRARQVHVPEMRLGRRSLRNLRLPAIDLSSIGEACGHRIDGIFGVDLLEQLGSTLDLKRRVLLLGEQGDPTPETTELMAALHGCHQAFNRQDLTALEQCFDPRSSLFLHSGEFHGREACLAHIRRRYFAGEEGVRLELRHTEVRVAGDTAWSVYEFSYRRPSEGKAGRGMMVLRRTDGKWRMLSMHDFPRPAPASQP